MKTIETRLEWEFEVMDLVKELAYWCDKVEKLTELSDGLKPVKGKDHPWVEQVGNLYVIYYRAIDSSWVAMYIDKMGRPVETLENDEPFDFKAALPKAVHG